VLRPEKIELSEGPVPAGRLGASGRVIDVAYLGMVTRYTVELENAKTMTAVRQNRSGGHQDTLAPESRVTVSWDLADAFDLVTNSEAETQLGATLKGAS
jgi:putrescine transport system ATP-binding protein